jgi:hypothetical protein
MPGRFLSDLSSVGAMAKERSSKVSIQSFARYFCARFRRDSFRSSPRFVFATPLHRLWFHTQALNLLAHPTIPQLR